MDTTSADGISGYRYTDAAHSHARAYLLPAVLRILRQDRQLNGGQRFFELGCGNVSIAADMARRGCDVTGVGPIRQRYGPMAAPSAFCNAT
jgi:hypothetical protein